MSGVSEFAKQRVYVLSDSTHQYILPNASPERSVVIEGKEYAVFSLVKEDDEDPTYVSQQDEWCVWRSGPSSVPVYIRRDVASAIETISREWLMEPTHVKRKSGVREIVRFGFVPVQPKDALKIANI